MEMQTRRFGHFIARVLSTNLWLIWFNVGNTEHTVRIRQ